MLNIKLRPLSPADIASLTKLANNEKVSQNLRDYFPHPYSEQDAENFINLTLAEKPQQNFAIEHNDELCGVIGVVIQKDVYQKSAELGYWLGEPYWGNGIATIAVGQITKYGFEELELARIFCSVFDFNVASMKVLERNGFEKEGVFKKAVFKNSQFCDEHRYFKLNDE